MDNDVRFSSADKQWSLELIRELEWRRFEQLCRDYYRLRRYTADFTKTGADGGVDVLLRKKINRCTYTMYVQCKAWPSNKVGVKPVREFYGVMAADQIKTGFFFTSGSFTQEAKIFAKNKKLHLISGSVLLGMVKQLPDNQQEQLLQNVTRGDYKTPTCPNCDIKMVSRTARKGASAGQSFWGCINYPRCHQTLKQ
ncbi:restriction endonuclease [Endozoicomonas euniceicola]|uniref:Restriction endonuclease n=1 Tax=Endozoicomonas euniceicola TaxID=1234143 RepID=A0ABY6GUH5_9GAMM|nr:restriction endonuclease [Endozoicomonas euniceicola]UYM16350.1 restriction endonuclease [Endozoicomonas euniceicola]